MVVIFLCLLQSSKLIYVNFSVPRISKKMETPGTELTLALIKPDAVQAGHVEKIMHAMEMHGFVIVTYACVHVSLKDIMKFVSLFVNSVGCK